MRRKAGKVSAPLPCEPEPLILFRPCGLGDLISPSFWAYIWIDYARFDPSYADSASFGWAIDVGNGHTTLLPSLFMLHASLAAAGADSTATVGSGFGKAFGGTFGGRSAVAGFGIGARMTGVVGLLLYYQTFYGTILYALSYLKNSRYRDSTWTEVNILLCVCATNAVWIIFPLLGLRASLWMIAHDNFVVIHGGLP
ncbi:unnamed protein product [Phaeothamnion confervicola]